LKEGSYKIELKWKILYFLYNKQGNFKNQISYANGNQNENENRKQNRN
jgi:hypothetical protein